MMLRPDNEDLGRAIRKLRKQQRMTLEDLAFASDVHTTYLSGIERGIRNPTWEKLANIAYALGTPLSNLVRHAETEAQLAQRVKNAQRELGLST